MKLYFRRQLHQDTKGMISRKTITKFLLHARIELTPEEAQVINKYQLGRYFIWERSEAEVRAIAEAGQQPFPNTTRIENLAAADGANVTFDSFVLMRNAEDEIKNACAHFSNLLTEAREFEMEQVFEF